MFRRQIGILTNKKKKKIIKNKKGIKNFHLLQIQKQNYIPKS